MSEVNYPSWDAKSWLEEFEASKQVQGGTRPVRAKVFQSTLEIIKSGGYRTPLGTEVELPTYYNDKALQDNVFCEREITLRIPPHKIVIISFRSLRLRDIAACSDNLR